MGLFGFGSKGKSGGILNVIRCDEPEYLIWKWRPEGQAANSSSRENAIRYGSSLRVKDGEVAVFVYKQKSGAVQDFIVGPYDDTIKTANFPVLSSIVGLAFGGESPFQAEVYFINLSGLIQLKFGVPYFDVFDPRFQDFAVPVAVRGTLSFKIKDYKEFIKLHRLIDFNLPDFERQIKDAVIQYARSFVTNVPSDYQIPVIQIERKTLEISRMLQDHLSADFEKDFGVELRRLDLSAIEIDKESPGYVELRSITADQQKQTIVAQTQVNIKNLQDTQRINSTNMEETLRVQREELQRAQRLQSEQNYIGAHALDQQTSVLSTAAQNLGSMGSMDTGGGGSMNPAGMMTGMAMGGAMGGQIANMMNQMGSQVNQQSNTPPPPPQLQYMIAVNGQQSGPFNLAQLQQLTGSGQFTPNTYVWKAGMAQWELAGNVPELAGVFMQGVQTPPPPPPAP